MKFAFAGDDCFHRLFFMLLDQGHEIIGAWIPKRNNTYSTSSTVTALCKKHNIPVLGEKVTNEDLVHLKSQGLELLISGCYPHKIPVENLPDYHFNIHASLLPDGRGPHPLSDCILNGKDKTGITFHKISDKWDQGDILLQREIPVLRTDTHNTLELKAVYTSMQELLFFINNIETYWQEAIPQQEEGHYYKATTSELNIEWSMTTNEIDRKLRAFGPYGTRVNFEGIKAVVTHATCWQEEHNLEPGAILTSSGKTLMVASSDGFVVIDQYVTEAI